MPDGTGFLGCSPFPDRVWTRHLREPRDGHDGGAGQDRIQAFFAVYSTFLQRRSTAFQEVSLQAACARCWTGRPRGGDGRAPRLLRCVALGPCLARNHGAIDEASLKASLEFMRVYRWSRPSGTRVTTSPPVAGAGLSSVELGKASAPTEDERMSRVLRSGRWRYALDAAESLRASTAWRFTMHALPSR